MQDKCDLLSITKHEGGGGLNQGTFKPGFHIVVSVVSVVRKKLIGQLQLYGNLPYKCSIQKKRQIKLVVRDRMNSICPMNFFRTTGTTGTTDTTIWKPGFKLLISFKMFLKRKKRNHLRTFADAFLTCNVPFISARRWRGYVCAEPYSFCDIDV